MQRQLRSSSRRLSTWQVRLAVEQKGNSGISLGNCNYGADETCTRSQPDASGICKHFKNRKKMACDGARKKLLKSQSLKKPSSGSKRSGMKASTNNNKQKRRKRGSSSVNLPAVDSPISKMNNLGARLMKLGDEVDTKLKLYRARILQRPSKRNRSPFVADAVLLDTDIINSEEEEGDNRGGGREVLVHVPSMDMGGKCVAGAEVLVKPALTRKGLLVGAEAVGKYGTPKCEFIAQLLKVREPENEDLSGGKGVWVGAHPSLGEKIVETMVRNGLLDSDLPGGKVVSYRREVRNVAGTNMRCDFLITHEDGSLTILEVKTVVDTDYNAETAPERKKCVFLGKASGKDYRRAGIFPWGHAKQKGPDGEVVVSSRAIKHVDELAAVAQGKYLGDDGCKLNAAIVFVVVREDVETFRPNEEACESFVRHLKIAQDSGVKLLAHRISWKTGSIKNEEDRSTVSSSLRHSLVHAHWDGPISIEI